MTDTNREIKFRELELDGNDKYSVIQMLTDLTDEELVGLKYQKGEGTLTGLDLLKRYSPTNIKNEEEVIEEEVSSLEQLLKNDYDRMVHERNKIETTVPYKKIEIKSFIDDVPDLDIVPIEIDLTDNRENIFEQQMKSAVDTVQQEEVTETISRINMYRDEYTKRMQSINTMQDYTEYTKWHKWYFEEDKDNLTLEAKISAFILTVYVEARVYLDVGMDIRELLTDITIDKYPVYKPEDVVPQIIAMAKHSTTVIERESHNYNSNEMTFEQFSAIRANNFVNMYTAFI